MTYYLFDAMGRFAGTSEVATSRSTTVAPPVLDAAYVWNLTSWVHAVNAPVAPVLATAVSSTATEWLIDVGSYYDRFGAAKIAVLTSTDALVQAFIKDAQARAWIDLKHPDVRNSLQYIGTVISALTPAVIDSILNTPVAPSENLVLRKSYF